MCVLTLKTSHRPDGNSLLTCNSTLAVQLGSIPDSPGICVCSCSKFPIAPMGKCLTPMGFSHVLRLCLQGGGVSIGSGTVSFSSCTITGNTAYYVRAHPQNFPSPRWDFHMFCACLCLQGGGVAVWGGTVSFSSCTITGNTATDVRAHAQKFPSPRWENG